jgi:hypothetical protein
MDEIELPVDRCLQPIELDGHVADTFNAVVIVVVVLS